MEAKLTRAVATAADVLAGGLAAALRERNLPSAVEIHADEIGAMLTCRSARLREAEFGSRSRAPRPLIAQVVSQSSASVCAAIAECLREDLM